MGGEVGDEDRGTEGQRDGGTDKEMRRQREKTALRPSFLFPSVPLSHNSQFQKMSFSANCNCLDEPESPVAKRVLVILPKLVVPNTRPGWPKLVWLNRSKISVRNCALKRSLILVFLSTEKSTSWKPGPITTLRPRLPK